MPQMIPSNQAQFVALPGNAAQPVQKSQPQQQPAPDPESVFKRRQGPPILILPHDPDEASPSRQARILSTHTNSPVRLSKPTQWIGPVYHGTSGPYFRRFDLSGEGVHFGTREQAERRLGQKHGGYKNKVIVAQIGLDSPLRLPDLGTWNHFNNLHGHLSINGHISPQQADAAWDAWQRSDQEGWESLKQSLEANGHDGIVYENELEGPGDSYIVFRPHQIRIISRERFARPEPVRLSHAPALWDMIKKDPHNPGHWLILANEFEDAGRPHTAAAFREVADHVQEGLDLGLGSDRMADWLRYGGHDRNSRKFPGLSSYRPSAFLSSMGVPFVLYPLRLRAGGRAWGMVTANEDNPASQYDLSRLFVNDEQGRGILDEADTDLWPTIANGASPNTGRPYSDYYKSKEDIIRHHFGDAKPEAEKFARKKKAPAMPDVPGIEHVTDPEQVALIRHIAESPEDDGRWHVLANHFADRGDHLTADKIRWWVHTKREALHHSKIESEGHPEDWNGLYNAAQHLQAQHGHDAIVLAGLLSHHISQELHPINWESIRPYHKNVEALRRQIGNAHLVAALVSLGAMPRDSAGAASYSAWAAGDSAGAAGDSAWAAGDSAGAAGDSAWAAGYSARAASYSAWAAGDSARAAGYSARVASYSARAHIRRIGHALFSHPHWGSMPKEEGGSTVRFAESRAPAGGFINRGIFMPGGEFLPQEATEPQKPVAVKPKPKRSARERLRAASRRRKNANQGTPIRLD